MTGHSASGLVPDTIDWTAVASRLAGDRPLHGAEASAHDSRQFHQRRPPGWAGCRRRHQRHPPQPACSGNHAGAVRRRRCGSRHRASGLGCSRRRCALRPALDWIAPCPAGLAIRTMTAPGLILAAPSSGSGKTVTVLALLRATSAGRYQGRLAARSAPIISIPPSMPPPAGGPASISTPGRCGRKHWPG